MTGVAPVGIHGVAPARIDVFIDSLQADLEGTGVAPVRLFAAGLMEAPELASILRFPAVPSVSPEWPSAINGWVSGDAQASSWIEEDTPGYESSL